MTQADKSELGVNADEVRKFFTKTIRGQIHLTAISTDKSRSPLAIDFCTDAEAAIEWALSQNAAGMGVYYSVNGVRTGLNKKAKKDDIVDIRFAHVDIDPPKGVAGWTTAEREQFCNMLGAALIPPCCVVWSGNGLQALWRIENGVSAATVEDINKRLIVAYEGDHGTYNVDRILRVPGLINWPNEKKRIAGRVPALAHLEVDDDGSVCSIEEFLKAFPPVVEKARQDRGRISLGELTPATADSLYLGPDEALRDMIDKPKGNDRSADTFAFACEALRRGLTTEQIAGVLLNDANAIAAHCLDQTEPRRAVERAIAAALSEDDVHLLAQKRVRERELDRRLAAGEEIEPNDETRLWTLEEMLRECVFIEDGAQVADTNRPGHLMTQSDFRASTAASKMKMTVGGKGGSERTVEKRIAEVWLEHVDRRSVATLTFRPGADAITIAPSGRIALNSWGGFRSSSPPQDWQARAEPFEAHVRWLFGDDADAFLDWVAHIAQQPGVLPSFGFLHIARNHGMGRNWIASILGRVFVGFTALAYDLSGTLRTGYNGVLAAKVLAIVDEIDEGNSQRKYQIQQELKQLVTEETRTINPKYGRQHLEWNCCRMLIFSNSLAALPLEDDDRRLYVVDCDDQPKEEAYYKRLYQLKGDNAFIASVAEFLKRRDILRFNPGQRPPLTRAKAALLERCRSEAEQSLFNAVAAWPGDLITMEELHELMGDERPKGAALRYALDRAGIVRVREWLGGQSGFGTRVKVKVYALRNAAAWKDASLEAVRAELGRVAKAKIDADFYSD